MKLFEAIKVAAKDAEVRRNLKHFVTHDGLCAYIYVTQYDVEIDCNFGLEDFFEDDGWKIEVC